MIKRLILAAVLMFSFSTVQAAEGSLADTTDKMVVKEAASFKGADLTEVAEFLSSQTGVKVVCVPETAGQTVDLEIANNETLTEIFKALSRKYTIAPVFRDKQHAILLVKGQYYGIPKPAIGFSGEARLRLDSNYNVSPAGTSFVPITPFPGFNTEGYKAVKENVFQDVLTSPLSTFSIDVDTASYSNVRRFINSGQLPHTGAVRIEEMINYFAYDYPQPNQEHPFSVTTEAAPCPWNPEHSLVMIGLKGKNIDITEIPPMNLVFLIDVSGSMYEPNKLPLVKTTIKMMVNQMRPQDSISIVTYAGHTDVLLDSASGSEKAKILKALDGLTAGGSTNGSSGIQLAYELAQKNFKQEGNNRIVLATDGDFNVGVQSEAGLLDLIKEKRDKGIFLSVLGFGMGNYKDNKMETLADNGNGNYAYIDTASEAKKVAGNQLAGTLFTIAKDVKLQVEFNPAQVKAYKLVGYEDRVLNKEDFNNDKVDAGDMGAGHSVTAFYEIISVGSREKTANVDSLQYQKPEIIPSSDLMLVKVRYKKPNEDGSILFSKHVGAQDMLSMENTSDNFRFAAGVAEYAMLLRKSEFKGNASYNEVLKLSKGSKGQDEEGYRAEFIKLVEVSQLLEGAE
ncbi:MAG: VWA domain-containing protein [Pelosinus sp.]|nr:VWA domain-containing protein [Pelosinus sp.]